jgi:hypothetical protein
LRITCQWPATTQRSQSSAFDASALEQSALREICHGARAASPSTPRRSKCWLVALARPDTEATKHRQPQSAFGDRHRTVVNDEACSREASSQPCGALNSSPGEQGVQILGCSLAPGPLVHAARRARPQHPVPPIAGLQIELHAAAERDRRGHDAVAVDVGPERICHLGACVRQPIEIRQYGRRLGSSASPSTQPS